MGKIPEKRKADAPQAIKDFLTFIYNQFDDVSVKRFRSDNGGEYCNDTVRAAFKHHGIDHELTPPYAHESNGVAERFNRTIATSARSMIEDQSHLFLWAEAVQTAVTLRSLTAHSSLPSQITPFEALYNKKPQIGHLRVLGTRMLRAHSQGG